MSAAGDRLRAERERFERELRLSEATKNVVVGADESAHFLADSPRTDDDAVWDLPGDEASTDASAGKAGPVMPTTPYREAMRAARAVDAAPAAPPSPKLESPTSDMTASIREALDAAERGLRASVIATDQMERLAASRGTRAVSSRRGETATPRDAAALLAAGDEDPEAQAYLKGVLRMIYGGGDDDEDEEDDDDDDEVAPARALRAAVARARDGLSTHLMGDDSAREAVVARHAHTRASAAPAPAPAAKAPPSGSNADAAVPEPFAFRTDFASATAVDFQYEVFGAISQATVTRTTAMVSAPPPTTTETDAPPVSSPAAASPGGLPPTPTAVKARAASTGSPEAAAMFDEFHRLERGLAEYVAGSPEPGSSPEEKPRAEPPAKRPAARSTSPYRPATADDVVAVAGGSARAPRAGATRAAAVRSAETTANAPPPPRVDAAPKAASKQNSPAASSGASSPASTIDPVAREALDAMDPRDRTEAPAVPDVAAPWSAALDAQTEAEAARKREARRKVEELLGGAFDYEEIRSVARAATAEAEKDFSSFVAADATTLGSSVPTTPPRVAPNGTARPRVARAVEAEEEKDFFVDVREAAAFGAGSSFAADPASVVADADASIEAFRAAMRAEVATRIVASASGVSAEVTEMARARRAATHALRKSIAGATRSRADARSARDAARKRATPPPRGAWRPPPEPPGVRPREASAARASIEARAEAEFAAGRSRSAPARERPGASQDGTVASFAGRSSEAPARLSARGASAREAARRRGARAANAAKAREEAEKKREAELLQAEKAAEARRAAAEKKRVEVAFGRRAARDGNGARSDGEREAGSARKKREPERPRVTEVKPFNLSTGNHTRNKEELLAERENRRDPDVWEPSPAKSAGRLESEAGDETGRSAPAPGTPDASGRRRRGDDAEKEGGSSEKRRTSPRLDAARRARDELKRRSRAASRQSRVIHAASEAAAPAIAAAEEARRDADAAAAAAARAAAAASAAEALMMAEARRLRERRKELYSRGKDAEFAPARAASLEMDDAPLMASYSSLPDASLAAAREAAEDFGRDVSEIDAAWRRSSETPEKPPLRVSASLASPSPVKPPKPPFAGGPREPVQYDPSRRPGEDARAASDGAPAPAPAEPERRPAVEPFAFAAEDDGVATPPSPRSPAVSWTMGALDLPGVRLPGPLSGEENERPDDTRADAGPADATAAAEKPKREVPAVLRRAAEARAVLAAAVVAPERGTGDATTFEEGDKPLKASGRRLLFRGDDLAYTPPADVSAVSKVAPATSRSADGVKSDADVTDYGSASDGESDNSDGNLTAAAAAAVAAQLARADAEA